MRHSEFAYDKKFPILLPSKHRLTELIIEHEHRISLHPGVVGTLAVVRERYWPISGRASVKRIIKKCVTCYRAKPETISCLFGDLPKARTQPSKPFTNTGVDYCGPIFIKQGNRRNQKLIKTYVAVFVCFATKAVHLELAVDLSTAAFLAVLRRFLARRGRVLNIYCDNATNFVGAKNQLRELSLLVSSSEHQNQVRDFLLDYQINFHFIPPRSPHFGGLWEAAVKSFKGHFLKITKNQPLTYDEGNTLIIQIEGILNSRPLCQLSEDPADLSFLTPAHFLVGESLTAIADPDYKEIPTNRLTRYQLIQQANQHFWARWSREYIHSLQQRPKWRVRGKNLRVNDLVIVKDENTHPLRWSLGRVQELHPGSDGVVRVVTLRTSTGVYKRAVAKLCLLPVE